jgi:hypothetical protein
MSEYRNMKAKCLDRTSSDDVVLHEVYFERKEPDGSWTDHLIQIMATDPMDAIQIVRTT